MHQSSCVFSLFLLVSFFFGGGKGGGKNKQLFLEWSELVNFVILSCMQAFLTARLEEHNEHVQEQMNHYIFTDSDIAVVDDLGQLFDQYSSFHLALTFRNNKDQPLNSGFIAVRGTAEGLQRCYAAIHTPPTPNQKKNKQKDKRCRENPLT